MEAPQDFARGARAGSIRALERLVKCWTQGIGGPASPDAARIYQRAALRADEPIAINIISLSAAIDEV